MTRKIVMDVLFQGATDCESGVYANPYISESENSKLYDEGWNGRHEANTEEKIVESFPEWPRS